MIGGLSKALKSQEAEVGHSVSVDLIRVGESELTTAWNTVLFGNSLLTFEWIELTRVPASIVRRLAVLISALVDNRRLSKGGVDTGEERPTADRRVATKEHLTLSLSTSSAT